jgi:hypothetical protein
MRSILKAVYSVDQAVLSKYRDDVNRSTNDMVDGMRAQQLQRDRANAASQRNDWSESARRMEEDRQRSQRMNNANQR